MNLTQRVRSDLTIPFLASALVWFLLNLRVMTLGRGVYDGPRVIVDFALWFMVSWWLWDDARRCRFVLPLSYGLLFYLAMPLFLPVYLFQTRRWWGFLTIGLYVAIYFAVAAIAFAVVGALR